MAEVRQTLRIGIAAGKVVQRAADRRLQRYAGDGLPLITVPLRLKLCASPAALSAVYTPLRRYCGSP